MLLRLQFTAETFAHMLRVRFARQDLCVGKINDDYVVDRVEIKSTMLDFSLGPPFAFGASSSTGIPDGNGGSSTVPVRQLTFTQPVDVFVTTMAGLLASSGSAPAALKEPLYLTFTVGMQGTSLVIAFQGLAHPELLSAAIPADQITSLLKAKLPPVTASLDFTSALKNTGGPAPTALFAGLGATADASIIELRVELQVDGETEPVDIDRWSSFYQAIDVDEFTSGSNWAMLVDQRLLTGAAVSKVQESLSGSSDKFTLTSDIVPTWEPSKPGVSLAFSGTVKDACKCAWGTIDAGADITIDVVFSITDGALQQDIRLDPSADFWPALCCELTAALLWPLFVIEGQFDFKTALLGSIAYYYFGPLAIFVGAVFARASANLPNLPNCTKDSNDDEHFTCITSIDLNGRQPYCSGWDDWLAITSVRGVDAGMILSGSYTDRNLEPPRVEVASVSSFEWVPPAITCSGTSGSWTAQATVEVDRASGDFDYFFCSVEAIGTTAPLFNPLISIDYEYCPLRATVRITADRFLDDGCSLLIITSGGARVVDIPPMMPLADEVKEQFLLAAERWRLETCYTIPVPWHVRIKMHWLVDPGPDEKTHQRVYEVIGWELRQRALLRLIGPQDRVLAEGSPDKAGVVRMNLAVAGGTDVELLAIPPSDDATNLGVPNARNEIGFGPRIRIREMLLTAVGTVELESPALALIPTRDQQGRRTITVVTRDEVATYVIRQAGGLSRVMSQRGATPFVSAAIDRGSITTVDAAGKSWRFRAISGLSAMERPTLVSTPPASMRTRTMALTRYFAGVTPMTEGVSIMGKWVARLDDDGKTVRLFRMSKVAEF